MLNRSKYLNPKKKKIKFMFNEISKFYDIMNFIMTLGVDKLWRKKIVKKLDNIKNGKILDIATGTGDLAIEIKKKYTALKSLNIMLFPKNQENMISQV